MAVGGDNSKKTVLVITWVFPPDPTSVGQHMHDAAAEMARRGYRVVVLTANANYNDPSIKYPAFEMMDGCEVKRLPLSALGKKSIVHRIVGALSFLIQVIVRGLFTRRLSCILVSTAPPMSAAGALIISAIRRAPFTYWVMDLNPDQLVEMGWIKPTSPVVRIFDWFNRRVLKRAGAVITLDRFMAERVNRKVNVSSKMEIMAPWPHEGHLEVVEHAENPFRKEHDLGPALEDGGKFAIIYSGNHSVCTPLRTILDAALKMQSDQPDLRFLFIGGGTGKPEVDEVIATEKPTNILSLPYQPIDRIKYSLSSGDVHLVVVGPQEVGVRHPCKVYGAMSLGKPILLLAPDPCHVSDLVKDHSLGWHIPHGDVEGAIKTINEIIQTPREELKAMGERAQRVIRDELGQDVLCARFCDIIESTMGVETQPQRGAVALESSQA